ncbi:hypothetical protein M501DRAFT_1004080 [Patellaria atrata CBS 101060]|uniref:FAD-binding FR-type domain-containing protein n=1 Tax=Patellaria atrata CBS 101060 TaxID=1346257 RepID=A0A9P4SB53_9PEZI|nr:hypothetical protein M501DRAFT_1004080 [Patellaria atrata CBS 101060]
MMDENLRPRHIQDHSSAQNLIPHWGYSSRVWPCQNDPGSCEYLDAVYWMHDVSMLYSFILWAVVGGILFVWVLCRLVEPQSNQTKSLKDMQGQTNRGNPQGTVYRAYRFTTTALRRWLLPESLRSVFGRVSRLQLLVLVTLAGYLLIFSLVGIVYKKWVTPIKNSNKFNTRTGLGGFSDRVGVLAYALTPFTILLANRESVLSLLTGIPYHHFNFLHRWTGRIIFIQSFLHTLGWTIIEAKLYQPQPKVYRDFIRQQYMIFGVVAMFFVTFLYIFSTRWAIRMTGYEFFRKSHYVIALLYIACCWGHWTRLACWMIASLGLFFIDRGVRLLRTCLIHHGLKDGKKGLGFKAADANIQTFTDSDGATVVRLDFTHNHDPWAIGQHFYLCFPALTIWQSHPFTPASVPAAHPASPQHTYIIRGLRGETARLSALGQAGEKQTPVIITGPYGKRALNDRIPNLVAIAGGTGISFTLPVVTAALKSPKAQGAIEFVWIIRRTQDLEWILPELLELKSIATASQNTSLRIKIFITRDAEKSFSKPSSLSTSIKDLEKEVKNEDGIEIATTGTDLTALLSQCDGSTRFYVEWLTDHHPAMPAIIDGFIDRVPEGRIQVVASGPSGMGTDLRRAIAERSRADKVWKGDERWDMDLYWDDRMG